MSLETLETSEQTILKWYIWEITAELNALIISILQDNKQEIFYQSRKLQYTWEEIWLILCPVEFPQWFTAKAQIEDPQWVQILYAIDWWSPNGVAGLKVDNNWIVPPRLDLKFSNIQLPNINWERICNIQRKWAFDKTIRSCIYDWIEWYISLQVWDELTQVFHDVKEVIWGFEITTKWWVRWKIKRGIDYKL